MAELAKLDEITEKAMLGIKGIGEKKVQRFAKYFITQPETDETADMCGALCPAGVAPCADESMPSVF